MRARLSVGTRVIRCMPAKCHLHAACPTTAVCSLPQRRPYMLEDEAAELADAMEALVHAGRLRVTATLSGPVVSYIPGMRPPPPNRVASPSPRRDDEEVRRFQDDARDALRRQLSARALMPQYASAIPHTMEDTSLPSAGAHTAEAAAPPTTALQDSLRTSCDATSDADGIALHEGCESRPRDQAQEPNTLRTPTPPVSSWRPASPCGSADDRGSSVPQASASRSYCATKLQQQGGVSTNGMQMMETEVDVVVENLDDDEAL